MTITIPSGRTIALAAKDGGGFQSEGLVSAPTGFVAMIAEDNEDGVAGNTNSDWAAFGTEAEYSSVRAKTGSISTMLTTSPSQDAPSCGGSTAWSAARNLLSLVPVGKTVWQRIYHYIPSEFSMGYAFGAGDGSAASTCGAPTDGGLMNNKWMRFSPDSGNARIYVQPYTQRRQVLQDANAGIRVITEATGDDGDHTTVGLTGAPFPRDEWFSLQLGVKVSKTGDGFIRAWIDEQLVAEMAGVDTISAAAAGLIQWGLGPYWNGEPWDPDGDPARARLWIDEVIVATDADGYEAPTGTDANGNTYIDPATMVGDLT